MRNLSSSHGRYAASLSVLVVAEWLYLDWASRAPLTEPSASNRALAGFKCRERAAPSRPRRSL